MKAYLPFYGEFGWYLMLHVKRFHADPHPDKLACIKPGHECLFPTAKHFFYDWQDIGDPFKMGVSHQENLEKAAIAKMESQFGHIDSFVSTVNDGWNNKHDYAKFTFIPQAKHNHQLSVDVVVCPRNRKIDTHRNMPNRFWQDLVDKLVENKYTVGVCGKRETSLYLGNVKYNSFDYIDVDSDVELLNNAKLVIGQESGMQYLTFMCQRPYICVDHYHHAHGADLYRAPDVWFANDEQDHSVEWATKTALEFLAKV